MTLTSKPASSAQPTPSASPELSATPETETAASPWQRIRRLEANVSRVLRGKQEVIRQAVVCLLARGHVLMEDVPGVGKTTLAQALARSLGVSFQRIQFTSDLLPSDIIGVSIYRQRDERFEFVPGPLFANVLLADEINRATPKTQSALLEAMSEGRVSVDRKRYTLTQPFLVIATQNPLEYHGTFPLPESQLDRFLMSLELGYPPRDEERDLLLSGGVEALLHDLQPVLSREELLELQQQVPQVQVADKLADYILDLAVETRKTGSFLLGVSTRGVQSLYRAVQAHALCEGRTFAIPEDVHRLAVSVLSHRILLRRGAGDRAAQRQAIEGLLESVPVPR
ncbi:MAG: MoxR family ATPase [Acidobacteriota bacterium]|nr:MoxR family ATPase [Acidobacteriota bacterium]